MNMNKYSFIFSSVSFFFLRFSYCWFSTRNNLTCKNVFVSLSLFLSMLFCWCWSCLFFYLSEKRMNGWREMTGDSSNIGCLEALAVPSTNNSAQSALRALILLDCIQEVVYSGVYKGAIYTPVYSLYIKQ